MKKTLLFLFGIGALLFSSCSSDDDDKSTDYSYVTISGEWTEHLTSELTGQDSVVVNPKRMIKLTWSDMNWDSTQNMVSINSQVTIGNGVWRLYSYINGKTEGTYTMSDSSYATYTYTIVPNDTLYTIKYKQKGTLVWEKGDTKYGKVTLDAKLYEVLSDSTLSDKPVSFSGPAYSALER